MRAPVVALAGKQLASDRKGSAMRGLSRAPKPTKKWRTCKGRRKWEAAQASDLLTLQPCRVALLGSRGRHHREWDSRSWELEGGKRETGVGGWGVVKEQALPALHFSLGSSGLPRSCKHSCLQTPN